MDIANYVFSVPVGTSDMIMCKQSLYILMWFSRPLVCTNGLNKNVLIVFFLENLNDH